MATATASVGDKRPHILPMDMPIGFVLGPLVGLLIWWLPLGIEPAAHKAFAIVGFMLVYWITEALDHGMTALIGCFLFWVLRVAPPAIAFSGFTKPTPWFVFGVLLVGQAVSRTGLAKRVGYHVIHMVGSSYTRLMLGFITLVYALNLLIPSHTAQIVTLAPFVIGIVAALGLEQHSNVARGLFVILTYAASLFGKMFLSSSVSTLAYGITVEQTRVEVLWSQWFLAFFPLAILTIVASWLTIRWLFPPETSVSSLGQPALQKTEHAPGPWSREEHKVLGWLLLGIALWATDFLHHVSPAAIGIGLGLVLTLPKVGVLDIKSVKSISFPLILFVGGVLSMAAVLTATRALDAVVEPLLQWLTPLLSAALPASLTLYWGGFLYHLFVGSEFTMSSTLLPVLLHTATFQGYNPAAVGMLWTFAGTGKLFVYQSVALIFGYAYGIFTARDLLKVGAVLTVVEGFLIMVLVPVYWPLIGLAWTTASSEQRAVHAAAPSVSPPRVGREEVSVAALAPEQQAPTAATPPSVGPDPEAEAWRLVRGSTDPEDFITFLTAYPTARFAVPAFQRLRQLQRQRRTVRPAIVPEEQIRTQQWAIIPDARQASPAQIRHMQTRLREAGYAPGPIDGIFGPRTAGALRRYQAHHGLPVTGRRKETGTMRDTGAH